MKTFGAVVANKIYHLQSRLQDNLIRVNQLISTHQKLYGKGIKKKPTDGDILRAAVVMLHASLEDFLRGISIVYLPTASIAALNKIPLLGLDSPRAEKFQVGALLPHKNKTVGRLIELSGASHLQKTNYSSTTQIDQLLKDCGKSKWATIDALYPSLTELMERRHRIVHRSDSCDTKQKGRQKTAPIGINQVKKWLSAVTQFEQEIVVGIINSEHAEFRSKGYIHYLNSLGSEAVDREVDGMIAESSDDIMDTDEVSDQIASTNASGFYIDDYHVTKVQIDGKAKECRVSLSWHSSGDSDPDKAYLGNELTGTAVAVINDEGTISYEEVSAVRYTDFDFES